MASIRSYYLGTIPEKQVIRGQAALIIAALQGTTKEKPKTTVELAVEIKPGLITRQEPERVVAFYMSIWKKKGWVRSVDISATGDTAKQVTAVEGQPQNVHEEMGTSVSANEHRDASMETAVEEAHQKQLPDLRGKKLSEAVNAVLEHLDKNLSPEDITLFMNKNGYEFTNQQVTNACSTLVKKKMAKQVDGLMERVTSEA
jgi:hypothetical protein